jgi:hypothetical protein
MREKSELDNPNPNPFYNVESPNNDILNSFEYNYNISRYKQLFIIGIFISLIIVMIILFLVCLHYIGFY